MSISMLFVSDTAVDLSRRGATLPVPLLAERLNSAGCLTSYGTEYRGGRGTYRLIHATYDALVAQGRHEEADAVAESYIKPDGTHARDREDR